MEDSTEWKRQYEGLQRAYNDLRKIGKHIAIDCDTRTLNGLRKTLDYLTIEHDVVLVVVDYFRKILVPGSNQNPAEKQARKSESISDIAKNYDTPILCIFDVTKSAQQKDKITMEGMRDGAAAMFDADNILVVNELEKNQPPGMVETRLRISVEKQRWGPGGRQDIQMNRATGHVIAEGERGDDYEVEVGSGEEDGGDWVDSIM
jgi:replicative DNA helicase